MTYVYNSRSSSNHKLASKKNISNNQSFLVRDLISKSNAKFWIWDAPRACLSPKLLT